ncbi:MAG: acyl-CoA dehydrogenase family protein [Thermodesulfobacteriota bacterium]
MCELTRSQKEIQKAAQEFAKGEFDKEVTTELEKEHSYPERIWKKAADLGFVGIQFAEKYGGGGLGLMDACLVAETLCRRDSTMGSAISLATFGAECLHRFGDEKLKAAFLPKVIEGEVLTGIALFETERGDDFSVLETTAKNAGSEWVITGKKRYVINGGKAGFYLVLCRTEDRFDENGGTCLLLVEADREGLGVTSLGDKLALNSVATADLSFSQVRVPQTNAVGKEGRGISQVKAFLDEVKILAAARAVGIAAGALDRALVYVKQREQFDRKLAQFQITRHKIADMATKVELARLITYRAAADFDKGKSDPVLSAMAKMAAGRMAVEVADEAIQLFGGYGYMTEQEVERYYRDAKTIELCLGTRESQKDLIADTVIGKLK